MKSLAIVGFAFAAAVSFTGCDPKPHSPNQKAHGPQSHPAETHPGDPTLATDPGTKPQIEAPTEPKQQGNVIPEPTPHKNPEYGIKIEGKSGYVKSPYDGQGRPIDVRGLPPGTEVEDPYTPGRTLLVP